MPGVRKVMWSRYLLDSYLFWTGRELIERAQYVDSDARALFAASFVVVSHGMQTDEILNYGNQAALDLWGVSWAKLTSMPSRLTAEPMERAKRRKMLEAAVRAGCIQHYEGIRVTLDGRRFQIHDGVIWNVLNPQRQRIGQAATFGKWTFL